MIGFKFHGLMAGVMLKKGGVLVTPDSKNDRHTSAVEAYGYTWNKGNLYDPILKSILGVLATIHTHLTTTGDPTPSYYTSDGYGDAGYFGKNTPYKAFVTIGWDNKVHADYAFYDTGASAPRHSEIDSYLKKGGLSVSELLNGYDLMGELRKYIFK